jgi:hypothetical protein
MAHVVWCRGAGRLPIEEGRAQFYRARKDTTAVVTERVDGNRCGVIRGDSVRSTG